VDDKVILDLAEKVGHHGATLADHERRIVVLETGWGEVQRHLYAQDSTMAAQGRNITQLMELSEKQTEHVKEAAHESRELRKVLMGRLWTIAMVALGGGTAGTAAFVATHGNDPVRLAVAAIGLVALLAIAVIAYLRHLG
jgi:hypothetical protein